MDVDNQVAIVGIGCRFPGADDIDEFWRVLKNGENHVIEVTDDRWSCSAHYDPDKDSPGKTFAKKAGLVKNFKAWDNQLYGINDIEASRVDPQQRFVLDCVHMAMEDGGITRKQLNGSDTGVYIGSMNNDYKDSMVFDPEDITNYTVTGQESSILAARVSYVFNLLGPAITVNTACSSALVAIHTACQALKLDDCGMAICGGVNVIMGQEPFVALSRARMVGATGQCQSFSDQADGYARGEGCGVVILKKHSKALSDGNKIWGLIRTACNQDGRTVTPITAPSNYQQMALLEKIYQQTGIDPNKIQYIEAHGTGTPVGDPIEANTLGMFFLKARSEKSPHETVSPEDNEKSLGRQVEEGFVIPIGSVKSNIGHTESAAGMAGLIKILLMIEHGRYVPSLLCDRPNPKIEFDKYNLKVCQGTEEWLPSLEGERMACINCFGFGGTNSHAIVTQQHTGQTQMQEAKSKPVNKQIVVMSAASKTSLQGTIEHSLNALKTDGSRHDLESLSYTSSCRRDHFVFREAFCVKSINDLVDNLSKKLDNEEQLGSTNLSMKPRLIFVFCGVGTVWLNMCREMIDNEPIFLEALKEVDRLLLESVGSSVLATLQAGEDVSSDPFLAHISIFACQVSLVAVWKHYGVQPDVVVGQSVGEVAAAYAAGVLSLPEAVVVIYHRSRLLAQAKGGRMLVIAECPTEIVEELCNAVGSGRVNIAVYSNKMMSVVAGDEDAISEMRDLISERNKERKEPIITRSMDVQCAYHSPHVDRCKEEMRKTLPSLTGSQPTATLFSTVTGKRAEAGDFSTGEYWGRNIRSPVMFQQALTSAIDPGQYNVFVEVGPKPVIHWHIKYLLPPHKGACVSSMKQNEELDCIRTSLCRLYEAGVDILWENVVERSHHVSEIPKYHFDTKQNLHEATKWKLKRLGLYSDSKHRFMKRLPGIGFQFRALISPLTMPLLYKHRVSNTTIAPGALYAEIGLEVAKQIYGSEKYMITISTEMKLPLNLTQNKEYDLLIVAEKEQMFEKQGTLSFKVYSESLLASGKAQYCQVDTGKEAIDLDACHQGEDPRKYSKDDIYRIMDKIGFQYGDELQVLHSAVSSKNQCLAEVELSEAILAEMSDTNFHPSVLDGFLQTPGLLLNSDTWTDTTILPIGIQGLTLKQPLQRKMLAYTVLTKKTNTTVNLYMLLLTMRGTVIAEIQTYIVLNMEGDVTVPSSLALEVVWKEVTLPGLAEPFARKETIMKNKSVLAVSHSLSKLHAIESILNQSEVIKVMIPKGTDLMSTRSRLKGLANSTVSSVIFVPGIDTEYLDYNAEVVLESVSSSCCTLLALVTELHEQALDIPLYVLTENVNPVAGHTNSLFGSELHGFVRSILKEAMYDNALLVDASPSMLEPQVKDLLEKVFNGTVANHTQDYYEIKVNSAGVFTRHVNRKSAFDPVSEYRTIKPNHSLLMGLYSSQENNCEDAFFKVKQEDAQGNVSFDEVSVRVHEMYVPKDTVFPVAGRVRVNGSGIPKQKSPEYSISCMELSGHVVHRDPGIANHRGVTHNETERTLISCFPVSAANIVRVPLSCTCYEDDLPAYVPGLLSIAAIYWTLVEFVPSGSSVAVLYLNNEPYLIALLVQMLRSEKSCKVSLIDCQINSQPMSVDVMIPMFQTRQNFTRDNTLEAKQMILVPQCFGLDGETIRCLKEAFTETKVKSLAYEDIFAPANLLETMPCVIDWLKHTNGNISPALDSLMSKEPKGDGRKFTVLQIGEDSRKTNIQLRVDDRNLFHKNACYVLVGGLTGLGWELLQWMAEKGAGAIITLSRRAPDEEKKEMMIKVANKWDCLLFHVQADICKPDDLDSALHLIRSRTTYPVRGIFHGGGRDDSTLAINVTEDLLKDVLRPKVAGTWNLHQWSLKNDFPLDYFVMHSSVSSLMGNGGQVSYSAANAFMDSFAFFRRSHGLCGQTINWGTLETGMMLEFLKDKVRAERFASTGMRLLSVEEVKRCFQDALLANSPQSAYVGQKSSLSRDDETREALAQGSRGSKGQSRTKLSSFMTKTFDNEHQMVKELEKLVSAVTGEVFALPEELITSDMDFLAMGLDSMLGMTFINRVFELTKIRIPVVTLLSEGSKMNTIVEFLAHEIRRSSGTVPEEKDPEYREMTFMQRRKFDMYERDNGDPSLVNILDLEIPRPMVNAERWKANFQHQVKTNKALRHVFVRKAPHLSPMVKVAEATEANLDFRIVDENEVIHKERLPPNSDQYHFDLSKQFAFRILFAPRKNGTAIMRMILHLITFDLETTLLLIEDLRHYAFHKLQKMAPPAPRVDIDAAAAVAKYVQPVMKELESFWSNAICKEIPLVTLEKERESEWTYEQFRNAQTVIPPSKYDDIQSFLRRNHMTLFELVVSLHQLVLHRRTGKRIIPVITNVDLRYHIPDLVGVMTWCINYVPLVAEIEEPFRLKEYLIANARRVADFLKHGQYPLDALLESVDSEESRKAIVKHGVVFDDISVSTQLRQVGENEIKAKGSIHGNMHNETTLCIEVNHNSRTVSLSLLHNPVAIGEDTADGMLSDLVTLVKTAIETD